MAQLIRLLAKCISLVDTVTDMRRWTNTRLLLGLSFGRFWGSNFQSILTRLCCVLWGNLAYIRVREVLKSDDDFPYFVRITILSHLLSKLIGLRGGKVWIPRQWRRGNMLAYNPVFSSPHPKRKSNARYVQVLLKSAAMPVPLYMLHNVTDEQLSR